MRQIQAMLRASDDELYESGGRSAVVISRGEVIEDQSTFTSVERRGHFVKRQAGRPLVRERGE